MTYLGNQDQVMTLEPVWCQSCISPITSLWGNNFCTVGHKVKQLQLFTALALKFTYVSKYSTQKNSSLFHINSAACMYTYESKTLHVRFQTLIMMWCLVSLIPRHFRMATRDFGQTELIEQFQTRKLNAFWFRIHSQSEPIACSNRHWSELSEALLDLPRSENSHFH